jgi:cell division protein FtsL
MLLLMAVTFVAVLHVRSRLLIVRLGYSLSVAADAHAKFLAERRKLVLEVATLKSPRRLRKLAVEQLGLVEPKPGQIIKMLSKGKSRLALN